MSSVLMNPIVARCYKPTSFIATSFQIFVISLHLCFLVYLWYMFGLLLNAI